MENPWADYIICGEGEYSFYRLAEVLREAGGTGSSGLNTVPGLIYRQEGRIYINPQMEPMNFNAIPFLYSLLHVRMTKSSIMSRQGDALSDALTACPVSTGLSDRWRLKE